MQNCLVAIELARSRVVCREGCVLWDSTDNTGMFQCCVACIVYYAEVSSTICNVWQCKSIRILIQGNMWNRRAAVDVLCTRASCHCTLYCNTTHWYCLLQYIQLSKLSNELTHNILLWLVFRARPLCPCTPMIMSAHKCQARVCNSDHRVIKVLCRQCCARRNNL